jgi:hypothetical protein
MVGEEKAGRRGRERDGRTYYYVLNDEGYLKVTAIGNAEEIPI